MPITEQDLEFPEAWRPKSGDFLIGKVVSLDERDGEYGSYPIVTVQRSDGGRLATNGEEYWTTREIADFVGRSTRQVYRILAKARRVAQSNGCTSRWTHM